MTDRMYTREDMARAWEEGFVDAVASMSAYQTNDRSGLIPNPYEPDDAQPADPTLNTPRPPTRVGLPAAPA